MKDSVCEQEEYVSYLGVTYWKVRYRYRCGRFNPCCQSKKISGGEHQKRR